MIESKLDSSAKGDKRTRPPKMGENKQIKFFYCLGERVPMFFCTVTKMLVTI